VQVELYNRGDIGAEFRLAPSDSPFAEKFTFEPSSGVLEYRQVQTITVTFASDLMGEFAESFKWQITGGAEDLFLDFRGRVVGPLFSVDVPALDFGFVSYSYRYKKEFTITNLSDIPMSFAVRILEDVDHEFQCVPATGRILPNGSKQVRWCNGDGSGGTPASLEPHP
jgi:hydrocephalus-inducing protein